MTIYFNFFLSFERLSYWLTVCIQVSSSHINGGVLLESASGNDFDQREMFHMYLISGDVQSEKVCTITVGVHAVFNLYIFQSVLLFSLPVLLNSQVFKKDIIFIIDISGSMRRKLIEDTKNALLAALSKLKNDDSFNIIAFNGENYLFSKSMELASGDAIERATEWITTNFVAGGGTNILQPLNMVPIKYCFFININIIELWLRLNQSVILSRQINICSASCMENPFLRFCFIFMCSKTCF